MLSPSHSSPHWTGEPCSQNAILQPCFEHLCYRACIYLGLEMTWGNEKRSSEQEKMVEMTGHSGSQWKTTRGQAHGQLISPLGLPLVTRPQHLACTDCSFCLPFPCVVAFLSLLRPTVVILQRLNWKKNEKNKVAAALICPWHCMCINPDLSVSSWSLKENGGSRTRGWKHETIILVLNDTAILWVTLNCCSSSISLSPCTSISSA